MKKSDAKKMRERVIKHNLLRPVWFDDLSLNKLSKITNGIGPDWLPEKERAILGMAFHVFGPAAMVHDCRYSVEAKYPEAKALADDEFYENMIKLIEKEPEINQFLLRMQAKLLYEAVDLFGDDAYRNGKGVG